MSTHKMRKRRSPTSSNRQASTGAIGFERWSIEQFTYLADGYAIVKYTPITSDEVATRSQCIAILDERAEIIPAPTVLRMLPIFVAAVMDKQLREETQPEG